ncbi:hypothetical protein PGIGA_G00109860 [Pangasianodon gigas]|uniref:Uncharacterized protein n=1 Tax=Pangasianodon gigas TaxID=30993 RepID=A0ACC5W9R4_PANGG|nr:hypothetical protein [Pangasianodon gigas]
MGKDKDLSNFDQGQIVMARRLDQSISKTAGCGVFLLQTGPSAHADPCPPPKAPTMGTWTYTQSSTDYLFLLKGFL